MVKNNKKIKNGKMCKTPKGKAKVCKTPKKAGGKKKMNAVQKANFLKMIKGKSKGTPKATASMPPMIQKGRTPMKAMAGGMPIKVM